MTELDVSPQGASPHETSMVGTTVRRRFRVGAPGIIVIAVVAIVTFGQIAFAHDDGKRLAFACGYYTGFLLSQLSVGLLLGYVAYRLSGRRNWVGNLALCLVLALFSAPSPRWGFLRRERGASPRESGNATALAAIQRKNAEELDRLRRRVEQGPLDPNDFDPEASRKSLEEQAAQSSGQLQVVLEASLRVRNRLNESMQAYLAAYRAFMAAGGLKPQALRTRDDVRTRIELTRRLKDESVATLACVERMSADFRASLLELGARPEDVLDIVAGQQKGAHLLQLRALRQVDVELSGKFLGVVQLLDETWGTWRYVDENDRIVFDSTADLDAYTALMHGMQECAAEEARLQREMFGASTPPTGVENPTSEPARPDNEQMSGQSNN